MTQEIKPTYVTREQAKWLKEKEFDLPTYAYYYGLNFYTGEYKNHSQTTIGDTPMHKMLIGYTSAPEQWQVVEWLRVNHGIWVSVNIAMDDKWYFELYNLKDKRNAEIIIEDENVTDFHNSTKEAYSAAFDYIKNNNLI
jgi:hypothetical protein